MQMPDKYQAMGMKILRTVNVEVIQAEPRLDIYGVLTRIHQEWWGEQLETKEPF